MLEAWQSDKLLENSPDLIPEVKISREEPWEFGYAAVGRACSRSLPTPLQAIAIICVGTVHPKGGHGSCVTEHSSVADTRWLLQPPAGKS